MGYEIQCLNMTNHENPQIYKTTLNKHFLRVTFRQLQAGYIIYIMPAFSTHIHMIISGFNTILLKNGIIWYTKY